MTRQTFPWPVAVTPTRVCLIRSIRFLPSSLSLRAEQTFHVYRFRSRSFIHCRHEREKRENVASGIVVSLSLSRRTWLRGALNETTSVCVLLFALYIVIMPSYRILLHIILSIITHENTSDTYGFYFIFENTKNTVCRDNTFSRSSISNVSSYTICKSHLTSSRVLSVPASRAPIHRFE